VSQRTFIVKTLLFTLLLMLGLVCGVNAQEGRYVADAQGAAELFEADVVPPLGGAASLSPDGSLLAATSADGICVLSLASHEETCFPFPGTFHGGLPARQRFNPLVWSPDSSRIVFTEEVFYEFLESDLWLLTIENGTISNLTDDHVEGSWFDRPTADFALDYLPAFAPNGDIYFFRSERVSDAATGIMDYTLVLHRLAAGEDTPKQIADLSELPSRPNRGAAVSPDGTQFVFAMLTSSTQQELWLVDLTSGEARQLTDADAMYAGMPEAARQDVMFLFDPVWVADGSAVVFESLSSGTSLDLAVLPFGNYVYVDVESGNVTPLVDLTDFPVQRGALESSEDADAELMRIPRDGALSSDGTAFVYLCYGTDPANAGLVSVPLPPGAGEAVFLGEVEYVRPRPNVFMPNPLMSSDDNALLGGWVFTFGQ
jgi:hypothetical protein